MKIAIISDIHEDIISLRLALNLIEKNRCDEIYCLGDIIGCSQKYCEYTDTRNADECIELLKTYGIKTLVGNHDLLHIQKIPEYKANFDYPENWFHLDLSIKEKLAYKKVWIYYSESTSVLNAKSLEYLSHLQEYHIQDYGNIKILFSHNYYPDFSGSKYVPTFSVPNLCEHFQFLHQNRCTFSFCGHKHVQGILTLYEPSKNMILKHFQRFNYLRFGNEVLQNKKQYITIPAIANQRQLNGFVIFNTDNCDISILSLQNNKPIFYDKFRS